MDTYALREYLHKTDMCMFRTFVQDGHVHAQRAFAVGTMAQWAKPWVNKHEQPILGYLTLT